jgi:predicted anti-sigma-YlaC factor YlaD
MSTHVSEWLNAYHDGELHGNRLQHVETHLAECELCQAELESLQGLSSLLHEVPTPEFTSVERFASQVSLRLPHKQNAVSRRQILELAWWMIPVGLLGAWAFIATSNILSNILYEANNFGLLSGISNWLSLGSSNGVYLSSTLGQAGVLSGNGLNWAEMTEIFTRMSLPQISLQISIALLYLSWIAIWWARYQRLARQPQGQFLEG